MSNFRRFLSRRWLLAFLGALALLFGVAMLHPYPRQSLFGPTIRGEPWCVWEGRVRRDINWDEYERSLAAKVMRWLGAKVEIMDANELYDHAEMLPLLLYLSEDPDPTIRSGVLSQFYFHKELQDKSALPTLRPRLADADMRCRIEAAMAIGTIDPKEPVLPVLLEVLNNPKSEFRFSAIRAVAFLARVDDAAFDVMARFAKDPDWTIRKEIMGELSRHGKRAVPALLQGVDDSSWTVRAEAMNSLAILGPDGQEAIPVLQRRLDDKDAATRTRVAEALVAINAARFGHLRAKDK